MKILSFFLKHKSNSYILFGTLLLFLFSPTTLYAAEDSVSVMENAVEILTEEADAETTPTEISPEISTQESTIPDNNSESNLIIEETAAPEILPQDTTSNTTSTQTEESFAVEPLTGTYYVTSSAGLNIRRGPSTSYDILGNLSYGKEISVTGKVGNDWFEIKYKNEKGYVSAQYVSSQPVSNASTSTSTTAVESAETATTTVEDTKDNNDFSPYFSNTPIVLLLLAIIAVVVIMGITAFSFFRHQQDSENDYDDYDDNNYDDNYYDDSDNDYDDNYYDDSDSDYDDNYYDDDDSDYDDNYYDDDDSDYDDDNY